MIRSEYHKNLTLDVALLTDNSAQEYRDNDTPLDDYHLVFDDDKFLLAFSIRPGNGLLAPGEIFLLVGKAYTPRYARETKKIFNELVCKHHGLLTMVNVGFEQGCRFAEFLGFRPRGSLIEHAGRRLQIYEVYL